jgi:hypothetical protein
MSASVVLTHLPRDASKALQNAGELAMQKGMFISLTLSSLFFALPLPYLPLAFSLALSLSLSLSLTSHVFLLADARK